MVKRGQKKRRPSALVGLSPPLWYFVFHSQLKNPNTATQGLQLNAAPLSNMRSPKFRARLTNGQAFYFGVNHNHLSYVSKVTNHNPWTRPLSPLSGWLAAVKDAFISWAFKISNRVHMLLKGAVKSKDYGSTGSVGVCARPYTCTCSYTTHEI